MDRTSRTRHGTLRRRSGDSNRVLVFLLLDFRVVPSESASMVASAPVILQANWGAGWVLAMPLAWNDALKTTLKRVSHIVVAWWTDRGSGRLRREMVALQLSAGWHHRRYCSPRFPDRTNLLSCGRSYGTWRSQLGHRFSAQQFRLLQPSVARNLARRPRSENACGQPAHTSQVRPACCASTRDRANVI